MPQLTEEDFIDLFDEGQSVIRIIHKVRRRYHEVDDTGERPTTLFINRQEELQSLLMYAAIMVYDFKWQFTDKGTHLA
jgi:hypothetical protein